MIINYFEYPDWILEELKKLHFHRGKIGAFAEVTTIEYTGEHKEEMVRLLDLIGNNFKEQKNA